MARKFRRSPGDLPQYAETWYVAIQQLRIWITSPDEAHYRPFLVLIFNLEANLIQKMQIMPTYPTPEQLLPLILQAIQKPQPEIRQKAHRPQRIQLEDANLVTALAPEMVKIGVEVQPEPQPQEIAGMIRDLETHLRGRPEHPGLLSVKGVTPTLVGGLFAAAAEFYRAAPWVYLTDEQTLAVRVEPEQEARFVQVMGGAGIEYGLAMYRRWADVERIFSFTDHPLELLPSEGGHSFIFEKISHLPFADVEAIEQYGWEVAGEQAYPVPVIYTQAGEVRRPDKADLLWYEAALRAIPIFVRDYLQANQPDSDQPIEITLSVPTHQGETSVQIKYPAGQLSRETRPVEMSDWTEEIDEGKAGFPPMPDRRAMEGMMAQFGGGFADSKLRQAQALMYKAWDESNPARRIILAHEALAVSADCTDAYVLLAEEEADTVGRALEYYRRGVEAGERALGQEYFEENVGYFWGLLETRPYMRARQGLADTLSQLGHKEEALGHYRELLRLNPGDNQGIRYTLLNLLLSMNDEARARALLKEYEEDGMAEWLYTRALLLFRAEGASRAAENALQQALNMNSHVPAYLTGRKRVPTHLPPYITWGGDDEAAAYAAGYLTYWRRTPGVIDWLQAHLSPVPTTHPSSRSGKRRGKRR